ncbi:MAG: hypothetical protein IPM43_01875 [Actinomycetota bacterium]|nr:MAG: hypothetical protein IPM43_01875 [Actinomycetota bacterium]
MTTRTWNPQALLHATSLGVRPLARRLAIDPALLCRPLTDRQADAYATRLGLHPATIWGNTWHDR